MSNKQVRLIDANELIRRIEAIAEFFPSQYYDEFFSMISDCKTVETTDEVLNSIEGEIRLHRKKGRWTCYVVRPKQTANCYDTELKQAVNKLKDTITNKNFVYE